MTTAYSHSTPHSHTSYDWKAILAEPFLIVATSLFWLLTLPLAAIAVFSVKIWDTVTGLAQRQANPLILRRGSAAQHSPLANRTAAGQV